MENNPAIKAALAKIWLQISVTGTSGGGEEITRHLRELYDTAHEEGYSEGAEDEAELHEDS